MEYHSLLRILQGITDLMKNFIAPFLCIYGLFSLAHATGDTTPAIDDVAFSGFECAQNISSAIPLLGRGTDFPYFVFRDIENSLQRQSEIANLVEAKCSGEAKQAFNTKKMVVDNQEQDVLTQLEVTIPMTIVVVDGLQTTKLAIEQVYVTTNLELPEERKTVQTFRVLSQQVQ